MGRGLLVSSPSETVTGQPRLDEKDDRIDELETETEELRERLDALEEYVATVDAGGSATPADD